VTASIPAGLTRDERVALRAYEALSVSTKAGGATVLHVPGAPDSPMLNRVVGLGVDRPATEDELDEAIAALPRGVAFYVAVAPRARPAELPEWLAARGLEPSWGWMAFRRGVEDPPPAQTSLRLVEVATAAERAAFARVARASYGLPEAIEASLAGAPDRGWQCWLALAGDEPAGVAGMYVADGAAYLGLAGTLERFRGRGAQGALLTTRIRRARELGCDTVLVETGERAGGRPSNSYRNILRAGFEEVGVTPNWAGRT
jgi:GNAT superfamily N-acetyltransferase